MKRFILACLIWLMVGGFAMGSYLTINDAGSTITVTTENDAITWTVATNNAILMDGSNPLRAWIKDDDGDYYVYSEMMFYYGTSEGTGISGNDYTANNITGNWYWYPLTSALETNQTAVTTALADTSTDLTTTGDAVTDMNIPDHISNGWCADGAIHVEPASDVVKITMDRTRYNQAYVIHEEGFRTGTAASPTETLNFFWDCDSTTLNVGTGSVTVSGATYASGVRGNGVLIDATSETAYIQSSGNVPSTAGTFLFQITGNDGTGTANARFFQHSLATNRLEMFWTNATTIGANINGTSITFTTDVDPLDGNTHTVMFSFDTTNSISALTIDGQLKDIDYTTITAPTVSSGNFYIGSSSSGTQPIEATIDEFKGMNACWFTHGGGPFLDHGNSYANPHESVTFFDPLTTSCSTARAPIVGTGTIETVGSGGEPSVDSNGTEWVNNDDDGIRIATTNCFDGSWATTNEGSISFLFTPGWATGNPSAEVNLIGGQNFGSAISSLGVLNLSVCGRYSTGSAISWVNGKIYHIRLDWRVTASGGDQTTYRRVVVDGVENHSNTETRTTSYTIPTYIYIGQKDEEDNEACMGTIKNLSITNDPNTPDQWSAMGAPRLLPNLEVVE